ncbi:MAG TPA: PIG-L family deacetylase [Armatimonadaceae bacterium]|nr:PIG-L family deacetylase [Armatimonadaceae bacterium]
MAEGTERKPVRALVIGAHPDDCEFTAGGLATKLVARGDVVKFVSATNGDAGHHRMGGGPLARRRYEETRAVAAVSGVEYEVLPYPDGRLEADLATRERFIALIREFQPDLLFTHRTNDYHPDHRRTGMLVQDASYLIRVPNICPQVPHLSTTPVILYLRDGFRKPAPFHADVVVATDDVLDAKAKMLHCHTSQVYEWLPYDGGYEAEIPPEGDDAGRLAWMRDRLARRDAVFADRFRERLAERYGDARAKDIRCAEVFEVSEYGRALPPEQVDMYFPM